MANIKFSQFNTAINDSDIDYLVGYKGADNVKIDKATLGIGPTPYMMTGVFTNMFGGDPGGNNRDVLEWAGASPAGNHSSALPILQNCKITAAGFKWISNALPTIGAGQSWTVNVYRLNNPLTDSVTIDANYTLVGALNITLTDADSGVAVGKFSSGLNVVLNAGDIIRIAGDETGAIGTTTDEAQLTVLFELI